MTALHVAAFHNQPHVVSALLRLGASADIIETETGFSALMMAILGGNEAAARELVQVTDPAVRALSGRTAMHFAVEKGMLSIIRALVDKGVRINEPTTAEFSQVCPLHLAVIHKQHRLVPDLLAMDADVDKRDAEKGYTPLLMAALLDEQHTAELLLQAGADPSLCAFSGVTAMYACIERNLSSLLWTLITTGKCDVNCVVTRGTALLLLSILLDTQSWRLL